LKLFFADVAKNWISRFRAIVFLHFFTLVSWSDRQRDPSVIVSNVIRLHVVILSTSS